MGQGPGAGVRTMASPFPNFPGWRHSTVYPVNCAISYHRIHYQGNSEGKRQAVFASTGSIRIPNAYTRTLLSQWDREGDSYVLLETHLQFLLFFSFWLPASLFFTGKLPTSLAPSEAEMTPGL